MLFNSLLREAMRTHKLTVKSLHSITSIPSQSIYGYLKMRVPTFERLRQLVDALGISHDVALAARQATIENTPCKVERTKKKVAKVLSERKQYTTAERILIKRFRSLSVRNRRLVQGLLYTISTGQTK